jgi:AcrR family transcriptional regulator
MPVKDINATAKPGPMRKRAGLDMPAPYHHGDLRAALLSAAEEELAANGVENFSLRGVAKRAGVSHAAPAHHFGDVNGLLTALATIGFERFIAMQHARRNKARKDSQAQLIAGGLGYIDFAMAHPKLFRLMFSSQRPDTTDAQLYRVANAAFDDLVHDVRRYRGADPMTNAPAMLDVMALWSMAHGVADLINSGRLSMLSAMPPAKRDATIAAILARGAPG